MIETLEALGVHHLVEESGVVMQKCFMLVARDSTVQTWKLINTSTFQELPHVIDSPEMLCEILTVPQSEIGWVMLTEDVEAVLAGEASAEPVPAQGALYDDYMPVSPEPEN